MSKQQSGVWSGVKIGCGIFIVLPLIIIGITMAVAVPACGALKEQKEAIEKIKKEARAKHEHQNKRIN